MKKNLLSLLLVLLFAVPCQATTYSLSISSDGSTSETGNTTVPNGGVSPFFLDATGSNDLYPQSNRQYVYGFQLINVEPSQEQAAAGGDWSGVSWSVFGKFKSESSDIPWESIDPVYLFKGVAANSSVSPEMRWIKAPPADLARIYFVSEDGNTVFGLATAKLIASEIPLEVIEPLIALKEGDVPMNANSGNSTFTAGSIGAWTSGAKALELEVISGTSAIYRADGVAPTVSTANALYKPSQLPGKLILEEADIRNIKMASGGGTVIVHYRLLNRKP